MSATAALRVVWVSEGGDLAHVVAQSPAELMRHGEARIGTLRAALEAHAVGIADCTLTAACAFSSSGTRATDEVRAGQQAKLGLWLMALGCPEDRPPVHPALVALANPELGVCWQDLPAIVRHALTGWWSLEDSPLGSLVRAAMAADGGPPISAAVQVAAREVLATETLTTVEAAVFLGAP